LTHRDGSAPPPAPPPAQAPVEASATAAAASGGVRARSVTLTLLGHEPLGGQSLHGDVRGREGFAYGGAWGTGSRCPATGVKIADVTDPMQPRWVSTVAATPGTSQEDMVVRSIQTPAFSGDLLVVGIQGCGAIGRGGLAVYDVTDPRNPVQMSF